MTRINYEREIISQLNEIEGDREFWFHSMTVQAVEDTIINAVKDSAGHLLENEYEEIIRAKNGFAKVAAMCMIAMDVADLKKQVYEAENGLQ